MKFVPRREKVRKGFTSPNGFALLAKVSGKSDSSTTPSVRKVTPLYDQEKDNKYGNK